MKAAVKIENLSVSYSAADAVSGINLTVSAGEFVNIVGPNGGGKTTLVNTVLGLIKPDCGTVQIFSKSPSAGKKVIGYVPQNAGVEKNFPITVLEAVETSLLKPGLNMFKRFKNNEKEVCLGYLSMLGIEALSGRQVNQLSGGEFQRMLIARALAREPEILLLDEPTANIDPVSARKIYDILNDLNADGKTVIMVSHDLRFVLESKKRTVYINKTVISDGIATEELYHF